MEPSSNYFFSSVCWPTRLFCAILSGTLLILIFPDFHLSYLGWVALVPMIVTGYQCSIRENCFFGFVTGAVALLGIHFWIFELDSFGWIQALVLVFVYASFFAGWAAGVSFFKQSRYSIILLAFFWVILEYIRSHLGFMANPFATLAHSQSDNLLLLQFVSITGEQGISFLLILTNLALAKSLIKGKIDHNLLLVVVLVGAVHLWGWGVIVREQNSSESIKVAVVQPCLSSTEVHQAVGDDLRLTRLLKLTLSIVTENPDLIVWPESSLKNLSSNRALLEHLKSFSQLIDKPIITGVSEIHSTSGRERAKLKQNFNGAYFLPPDQLLPPPYFKNILLPFGEYLPLKESIDWPEWLIGKDFGISPGTKLSRFSLTGDIHFSVLICWENLFSSFVRRVVQNDADFLVHIVNDYWFGNTAAARQHNLASVFRAVENGVPVIVASNTGPSILIDSRGQIIAGLPKMFEQGAITGELMLSSEVTFYNRFGDWFVALSVIVMVFYFVSMGFMQLFGRRMR